MKHKRHPKAECQTNADLPTLDAQAYARLTPSEQAAYRPVNPAYERLPTFCLVCFGIALFFLIIYIAQLLSPAFSDFFNRYISSVGRTTLAALTSWLPFSLGETLIWCLPLVLVAILMYAIRRRCDTWRTTLVFVGILLSVISLLFSLFVLNFSAGYRGTSLGDKLGLESREVSAEELHATAFILADHVNRETAAVSFQDKSFSVMPYSIEEMNAKLNDAYETFARDHDFMVHTPGRIKPVMASEVMSHMHTTGVYSFFTGEANINVNFPDYTLPFTAAHEMAHQRGVAREDEANFVAYLVCIGSEDPYIRYSGYLNMYEYVSNALYRADSQLYSGVYMRLNYEVQYEMKAYSDFFKQYQGSAISKVSETVNNTYLQIQGTPGTQSYGMVVDLAVAYYRTPSSEE